jgi:mycothiol synthase
MWSTIRLMASDAGFDWRPIEPGQAGPWARLLAAIEAVDREDEQFSEQDLVEEFSDPYCDFARGSIAAWAKDTMVAHAHLTARSAADPVHQMWYSGGVHPDYRGHGLGARLLEWAEQAAVPLHMERYPAQPLALTAGCNTRNTDSVALYAAHGYEAARWFHGMSRDLTAALPELPVAEGVEIVGFTAERSQDARLVRNEAFRDHWGSNETTVQGWAHFLSYRAFRPALSFLAYAGEEPLGIVLSQEYDAHTEATGQRELHIPLVGTRRAGRRRGIASALLVRALAEARAAGFATASLGVDADSPTGAVGLYQRLGFAVRDTWITQLKPLLPASPADPP